MSVHFDEGESAVRLEASLGNITKVLEKRNEVRLGRVRSEVAHITRGLPLRGLCHHHVIALYTVGGEVVMTEGGCWSHAHRGHSLLLGDGGLALLICPVAANGARTKPLSVHGAECAVSIGAIAESDKAITTRSACLHVPHNASFRHGSKGRKSLEKDFIVDLVGQIANEDVEVV